MANTQVILIADPNPHVRSFLSRELGVAGYKTVEAGACNEVFKHINGISFPSLVILEPDFPITTGINVLQRIQSLVPPIPQIIYTHLTEYEQHPLVQKAAAFVEKNDDPGDLFRAIARVIGSA